MITLEVEPSDTIRHHQQRQVEYKIRKVSLIFAGKQLKDGGPSRTTTSKKNQLSTWSTLEGENENKEGEQDISEEKSSDTEGKNDTPETEESVDDSKEPPKEIPDDDNTEGEKEQTDENASEPVLEEISKTYFIPLIVSSSQRGQLPPDVIKKSTKFLQIFDERDRIRIETENSKNDLESYIYDTREKLSDETIISMSTEDERQKLSDALDVAQLWLDEESENAKLSDFISKKSDLVSVGEAIFFRVRTRCVACFTTCDFLYPRECYFP